MKKYFVNGKQISETEAILIDMENKRLQQSNNIADWAGIPSETAHTQKCWKKETDTSRLS